jgi:hypothetical protein
MDEQKQNVLPADQPAAKDHSPGENSLSFIQTKFNAWQSLFILICVASSASMIFWAAACDILS